jgi:hypothetical protein
MASGIWNREQRTREQGWSFNRILLAADNPAAETQLAARTGYTAYLTKLVISVTTSAAQSIDIQDSAGTPVELIGLPTSAPEGCYTWDFREEGIPATESKGITLTTSAAGVAAYIHGEGYWKQTLPLSEADFKAN